MTYSSLSPKDLRAPWPRFGYKVAMVGGRIFVFGGDGCQNNLEMLTVRNQTWESILHKDLTLRPRLDSTMSLHFVRELRGEGLGNVVAGHSLAVAPNRIVIIGGTGRSYKDFGFVAVTPLK